MTEAISISEPLFNLYETTWRNITEGRRFYARRNKISNLTLLSHYLRLKATDDGGSKDL
jgi:hypothetical protein